MPKKPQPKVIEYNPAFSAHGYKHVRWIENASRGLRLVGFADEIARKEGNWRSIDHEGWYTYSGNEGPTMGEKLRGVVYQLPSRGEPLYVYGYADSWNKDCALLCFEPESDKMDAARAADRMAEIFAEHERDYHEAWDAGRRVESIEEEIKTERKEALAVADEMRAAKRAKVEAPTICAVLRNEILSAYRTIQKLRKERDELIDTFGKRPGFVE